jgi:hypothetical protein
MDKFPFLIGWNFRNLHDKNDVFEVLYKKSSINMQAMGNSCLRSYDIAWTQKVHERLFLYLYEIDFIQKLLRKNEKKLVWFFNFMFRYKDDVLSLNHSKFWDYVDHIYPIKHEI